MTRFDGVLFDCDGVLVDSEPITNGVLRELLNESGWALSQAECMQIFIGKAVRDERARIEAETGQPIRLYLMDAYLVRGLPTTTIAEEAGVDASTVVRWLARFGIPARKRNYTGRPRRRAA